MLEAWAEGSAQELCMLGKSERTASDKHVVPATYAHLNERKAATMAERKSPVVDESAKAWSKGVLALESYVASDELLV
jgi:hypothetical protein